MRQHGTFSEVVLAELRQQTPFLVVRAWDSLYAVHKLTDVATSLDYSVKLLHGSLDAEDRKKLLRTASTLKRLLCIYSDLSASSKSIDESGVARGIRELLFDAWRIGVSLTVAIVDRVVEIPASLQMERPLVVQVDHPDAEDVERVLQQEARVLRAWKRLSPKDQQTLLRGLFVNISFRSGVQILAHGLKRHNSVEQLISAAQEARSGSLLIGRTLQPIEIDPEEVQIGGMPLFRQWLWEVQAAFTEEGREFGLPRPRGILLVGVPGTGKSLAAKLAAHAWKLPLVRVDLSAVHGPYLGESEARMRETLASIDAFGPAVLLLDELDKLFTSDYNTSTEQRIRAYFFTWMQERREGSVVFATANDIEKVPPELIRRGRIDEVFFVDLPTFSERKEVWEVMLKRYVFRYGAHRQLTYGQWGVTPPCPEDFDLVKLASLSEGFTGAEIEECVRKALYQSFLLRQALGMRHLRSVLEDMRPQAIMQREQIHRLRRLVREGRIRSVSPEDEDSVQIPYYGLDT